MKTSIRLAAGLVTLSALAACGRDGAMADDLRQDLDQASAASVELAPRASKTAVVSALELGQSEAPPSELPQTKPVPKAHERAKAPAATHRAPTTHVVAVTPSRPQPERVAEAPAPVEEAPAPTPAPAPVINAPARAPMPIPMPSRMPTGRSSRGGRGGGGGWSTVGDVIRNAPFPINP